MAVAISGKEKFNEKFPNASDKIQSVKGKLGERWGKFINLQQVHMKG